MKLQKTLRILLTLAAITSAILLWEGISGNLEIAKQQQLLFNQITIPSAEVQEISEGNYFQIDNVTFSHHMAFVNGIQMHYVIGGHGEPIVLLHGWPETWYEWRHVMPALAEKYTVIVPDLRGLGDSSKPTTGYDGNTTSEDIYELVSQLGFNKIFLVGHDIGTQTAYSFAAAHPSNVTKLVVMEDSLPGVLPPMPGQSPIWWFSFHQVPDVPETLVQGKEREYLSWFYKGLAYNPAAITQADIDEYVSKYSAPGGMRAGFEYYRAFPMDAEEDKQFVATHGKLSVPVLVLGGDYIPVLGGARHYISTLAPMQYLAANVTGVQVLHSGHWIPEEQPGFLVHQLFKFFGNSSQ
jgi:pimeloyl-ACP methyl ester carboxylesterase